MNNPLGPVIESHAKTIMGMEESDTLSDDKKKELAGKLNISQTSLEKLMDSDGDRITPYHLQNLAHEAGYEELEDFVKELKDLAGGRELTLPFVQKNSVKIFVSYSHRPMDSACLERVRVHLAPLAKDGLDLWDDSKIKVGEDWNTSIQNALNDADAAILLISADFLASDYITNSELPKLLKNAKKNGVLIVPVIIKPCGFADDEDLSEFQALNSPDEPILGMGEIEQEEYWNKLRQVILEYMEEQPPSPNHPAEAPKEVTKDKLPPLPEN
ncbi:MAG TPA: hypothetical protein DCE41_00780 [Cytophagales bacterium]|nr:hypothetical protein [Cytophagales bacterium]HAA21933.1 hypothetical protein [Cytophagales bacterium]HAP61369.1 hypothetical protein [Cytophagales bacterium]